MTPFLLYDLKAGALLAAFYLLYTRLLSRDTHFHLRRGIMLASYALSFILPLCTITIHKVRVVDSDESMMFKGSIPATAHDSLSRLLDGVCGGIVPVILAGMVAVFTWDVIQLTILAFRVSRMRHWKTVDGMDVAVTDKDIRPFSFFGKVVMSRSDFALCDGALLTHERSHIRRFHAVDLCLSCIVTTFQWFNPASWLISRELRKVHEFEADQDVIGNGCDTSHYLRLILRRATVRQAPLFVNTFSDKGMVKERMTMLAQNRSSQWTILKAALLVPVIAISLAASSKTEYEYVSKRESQHIQDTRNMNNNPTSVQKHSNQKTPKVDKDSVIFYANGRHVDSDSLDGIDPANVHQITIVKHSPDESNESEKAKDTEVYIDLNDTIIHKIEENIYQMVSAEDSAKSLAETTNDSSALEYRQIQTAGEKEPRFMRFTVHSDGTIADIKAYAVYLSTGQSLIIINRSDTININHEEPDQEIG